jgi:hypothetical protein
MACYHLKHLYQRFVKETALILQRFNTPGLSAHGHTETWASVHLDCKEMCVIRLQDCWARFCRELVIMSAVYTLRMRGGSVLSPVSQASGTLRPHDIIPELRKRFSSRKKSKPDWWEPKWQDSHETLDAANILKIANYLQVSAGLSLSGTTLDEIRYVRNYLAHRSKKTAQKIASSLGVAPSHNSPIEAILSHVVPPGVSRFEYWVRTLRQMADVCTW